MPPLRIITHSLTAFTFFVWLFRLIFFFVLFFFFFFVQRLYHLHLTKSTQAKEKNRTMNVLNEREGGCLDFYVQLLIMARRIFTNTHAHMPYHTIQKRVAD